MRASEKISASALILSSRNVSVAGSNRVQKREAQSYLVTGANCLHTVRLEDAEPDARCTAGHAAKAVPRQGQCVKSYEARCRSSSEWFPASSLVCFCITCQAFFLSARKPASAPCAARISRTAQPPSRTRPQTRTKPHLCPPITGPNPNAPGRSAAPDRNGPTRRKTGFPQSLHRLFHIFAGFPQWLSFPLTFFERDRVRSSEQCVLTAQQGMVWYGWVRYGAPLLLCDITRDEAARRPPATRARTAGDKQCKPLQLLKISVCDQCYVNRFSCPVSNSVACAAGFTKTRPKAFLARSLRTFPREFCGILPFAVRTKRAALSGGPLPCLRLFSRPCHAGLTCTVQCLTSG
jgi:hypothetical protein